MQHYRRINLFKTFFSKMNFILRFTKIGFLYLPYIFSIFVLNSFDFTKIGFHFTKIGFSFKKWFNFNKILVKSNKFNTKMLKMYGKYKNPILVKRKMEMHFTKKCLKKIYTSVVVIYLMLYHDNNKIHWWFKSTIVRTK